MKKILPVILILFGLYLSVGPKYGCDLPKFPIPILQPAKKVTKVTYVWDREKTAIPRPVGVALNQLNTQGILASEIEESITDGEGQVPDQYKVAIEAAKKAGLPCLVVQAGDEVIRVVSDPKTLEAVLEAAK
jgi:hypothetical protein